VNHGSAHCGCLLLAKHIDPYLGSVPIGKVSTPLVRESRSGLLASGVPPSVAAKAYRLLRAVMMTAADEDRIIPRNPCRIRGAGSEHAPERPVLTVAQVFSPAELVGRRPIGNVRRLPDGSYRLRYQLAGQMKALPEVYPSKSDADGALWASWNPGTPTTVTTRGTGHLSCSPLSAACDGAK